MKTPDQESVVITGIGMITPLGSNPAEVWRRIRAGDSAAAPPMGFDASAFACPVCAQVKDFEPQQYASEAKLLRLMSRDAQFAVAAARLALGDAGVTSGATYTPEEIGLFGATGLAGLPVREVAPLIRLSVGPTGDFEPARFGQAGLKAVSPILSFKILSNMPFCFVSINENIQGPNGIYTPWEGAGAQAVEAGVSALRAGDARCALVGGCDVKTHELAFASLQQQGLFSSWRQSGNGVVPGEGAAFLVLETEKDALARGARVHARLARFALRPQGSRARVGVLNRLDVRRVDMLVGSANGDEGGDQDEASALEAAGVSVETALFPKKQTGDLFAAAALVQIALGATVAGAGTRAVLANCFGHGGTQAAFVLEKA